MTNRSLDKGDYKKPKSAKVDVNHLLVIGIDQYKPPIPELANAVNDAKAFKEVLCTNYRFEKANIHCLLNEEATQRDIIKKFDELLHLVGKDDNLILFFSGHGTLINSTNRGYWIPYDGVDDERNTYISNTEVTDFFRNLKARHIFGLVDSCFSGALFTRSRHVGKVTKRAYSLPSRWLLTAGREEPVSDGRLGRNSPFTASVIAQLESNTGPLRVGELCELVKEGTTVNASVQVPRGEPLQDVGHQGGEFVFFPRKLGEDVVKRIKSEFSSVDKNIQIDSSTIKPPLVFQVETGIGKFRFEVKDFDQFKLRLKEIILQELEDGLHLLKEVVDPQSKIQNQLFIQSAKLKENQADRRKGIISMEYARLRIDRIEKELSDLIENLVIRNLNDNLQSYF